MSTIAQPQAGNDREEEQPQVSSRLELTSAELEVLPEEVDAFTHTVKEPETRARYIQLTQAVQQGSVPDNLVNLLEAMLEILLQSQRIRRRRGPEAEKTLLDLFYRTPRGVRIKQAAREVNAALTALAGQVLESLTFAPVPGGQKLLVNTDRCRLSLVIDWAGVRVHHLEVGG